MHRGLAADRVNNGGGIGEPGHAIHGHPEPVARNHHVGHGAAVQIHHHGAALGETTKDVSFVSVVDAITISPDDQVGGIPSNLDEAIAQLGAVVENRHVRTRHPVGQNPPEIPGDAEIQALGVEPVTGDDDIELGSRIGRTRRDANCSRLRIHVR